MRWLMVTAICSTTSSRSARGAVQIARDALLLLRGGLALAVFAVLAGGMDHRPAM